MSPFSVTPAPACVADEGERSSRARRSITPLGVAGVVACCALWLRWTSVPSRSVIPLGPEFDGAAAVAIAAGLVWLLWPWRHGFDRGRLVAVVVIAVAVGGAVAVGYLGLNVGARFASHRSEFEAALEAADDAGSIPQVVDVPSYPPMEVRTVPGGQALIVGGHPAVQGFLHVDDPVLFAVQGASEFPGSLVDLVDGWFATGWTVGGARTP